MWKKVAALMLACGVLLVFVAPAWGVQRRESGDR